MRPENIEWLGIKKPEHPLDVSPLELKDLTPVFNFFDEFLSVDNRDDIARVFSSAVSSYLNSNLHGKHVQFHRENNKFIFEIIDDTGHQEHHRALPSIEFEDEDGDDIDSIQ
jgi:hypothetical protein